MVVEAQATQAREGIDIAMRALLDFGDISAEISCSMAADLPSGLDAQLVIQGDRGIMTVDNPLAPHLHHEIKVVTQGDSVRETVDGKTTYWHQLQHVIDVLQGGTPQITGGADAIANMQAIDAIYRAAGMLPRGVKD